MTNGRVYIRYADSYELAPLVEKVRDIFTWSGMAQRVTPACTILLKPNMLSRSAPEKAVTTHPAVVERVIICLKELGADPAKITVADSSGGTVNAAVLRGNYRTCGFEDVCERQGAFLYVEQKGVTVKTDGVMVKEFELIEPAVECDIKISLAKFKTHVMTGMSGAVKNLFGTVPGLKKAEFHMRFPDRDNFSNMMVDLCETVRPDLTIIDGILGMEGDGPGGGNPRRFNVLLAGCDPYTVDLAICRMMDALPSSFPIMKAAIDRGLAAEVFDTGLLDGEVELCEPIPDFLRPKSYSVDFSDHLPAFLRWAAPVVEGFMVPRPKIDRSRCIGCGRCRDICPQKTITIKDKKASIDPSGCIRCFCCHEMCPVKAIKVKRRGFFNI